MFALTEVTVDGVDTKPQTFTSVEEAVVFIKAELFDRDDTLDTDLEKIELNPVQTYPWEHKVDVNSQNGIKYFLITELGRHSISTKEDLAD